MDASTGEKHSVETLHKVIDLTSNLSAYKPAIIVNARAQYCLGKKELASGNVDAARSAYTEAVKIDPGLINAQLSLAGILKSEHDYIEAALIYEKTNKLIKARKCFTKYISEFGDSSDEDNEDNTFDSHQKITVFTQYGKFLMRQGHAVEALWQFDHAIELAVDAYAKGEAEKAVQDLMKEKAKVV